MAIELKGNFQRLLSDLVKPSEARGPAKAAQGGPAPRAGAAGRPTAQWQAGARGDVPASVQARVGKGVDLPAMPRPRGSLLNEQVAQRYASDMRGYGNLLNEVSRQRSQGKSAADINKDMPRLAQAFAKNPDADVAKFGLAAPRPPALPKEVTSPAQLASVQRAQVEYQQAQQRFDVAAESVRSMRGSGMSDAQVAAALKDPVNRAAVNAGIPVELARVDGVPGLPLPPTEPGNEALTLAFGQNTMAQSNLVQHALQLKRHGVTDEQLSAMMPSLRQQFAQNPAADVAGVPGMPPFPAMPADLRDTGALLAYQADVSRHTEVANHARELRSQGLDDASIGQALKRFDPEDFSQVAPNMPRQAPKVTNPEDEHAVMAYQRAQAERHEVRSVVATLKGLGLKPPEIRRELKRLGVE